MTIRILVVTIFSAHSNEMKDALACLVKRAAVPPQESDAPIFIAFSQRLYMQPCKLQDSAENCRTLLAILQRGGGEGCAWFINDKKGRPFKNKQRARSHQNESLFCSKLKGIVHQKNNNSVIIYWPSHGLNSVCDSFFCETRKKIF